MSALFLAVFATALVRIMLVIVTLVIYQLEPGGRLTNIPRRKTSINPDFSRLGSCSLITSRIGKVRMEESVKILMIQ